MSVLDWIVLLGTLSLIVVYGLWKSRGSKNISQYLKGDNSLKWGTIGLSVMATQASAITFLSTPGQAYESGMAFVQNYFGLPIAIIIVAAIFVPIYYKLNVYTAYEFLEQRFDLKTRLLGAFLFLIQRGLAAGITIYAPAIILSTMLHWDLTYTILFTGILVVLYTVSGGTKAVSITQKYQMAVIMLGMFTAFFIIVSYLPDNVSFFNALHVAGKMEKLDVVDFSFDPEKRYTIWTGLTGGFFLALSYFGADQSQVQRYVGAKSVAESRLGLIFNALFKVPMQFFILLVGVMVFVFYQFEEPPVFFKAVEMEQLRASEYRADIQALEEQYSANFEEKKTNIVNLVDALNKNDEQQIATYTDQVNESKQSEQKIRQEVKGLLKDYDENIETKDSDYVFLTFITNYLPEGVVGLLLAVIFSAAMSSSSGELNALGSTASVDFYKRVIKKEASDKHYLIASKLLTAFWGILAVCFALFASLVENLIEAVNILGSIFYGVILGMFLIAFFIKYIKGNAVFYAAIISQIVVIICFNVLSISYLWYNVIGCALVVVLSHLIHYALNFAKAE
ncbi:sodium:solute symporter [Fulvivirga sediminis]|uniref:Sodium:solute symporter n=1 Tax=Fulvivirga sediminis TaxID=2803949 RepID=A0A937FD69_9BACT|nr:sodium:solute symporter [Fulvivirga sediminis]MBL3658378.1 sodium:solute symporter [Fulvivirga sediminis]